MGGGFFAAREKCPPVLANIELNFEAREPDSRPFFQPHQSPADQILQSHQVQLMGPVSMRVVRGGDPTSSSGDKKQWRPQFVVLGEGHLLFYREQEGFEDGTGVPGTVQAPCPPHLPLLRTSARSEVRKPNKDKVSTFYCIFL